MKKIIISLGLSICLCCSYTYALNQNSPDLNCRIIDSNKIPSSYDNIFVSDDATSLTYIYHTSDNTGFFWHLIKDGEELVKTKDAWLGSSGDSKFYESNGTGFIYTDRKNVFRDKQIIHTDLEWMSSIKSKSGKNTVMITQDTNKQYRVHWNDIVSDGYEILYNSSYYAFFSDSEKSFIIYGLKNNRTGLLVNLKEVALYDSISEAQFFPNSERFAYIAKSKNKYFVVIDGKKQKEYSYKIVNLNLSSDGVSFAYEIAFPEGQRIVKNNSTPFSGQYPTFSLDGKNFAFVKLSSDSNSSILSTQSVVNNGIEGEKFKNAMITDLIYSPNGSNLSYLLFATININEGLYFFVRDGVKSIGYESVKDHSMNYSEDSKHLKYVVRRDRSDVLVIDGKEIGSYKTIITRGFQDRELRFAGINEGRYDLISCSVYQLSSEDKKVSNGLTKKLITLQMTDPKRYQTIIKTLSSFLSRANLSDKNYFLVKDILNSVNYK